MEQWGQEGLWEMQYYFNDLILMIPVKHLPITHPKLRDAGELYSPSWTGAEPLCSFLGLIKYLPQYIVKSQILRLLRNHYIWVHVT